MTNGEHQNLANKTKYPVNYFALPTSIVVFPKEQRPTDKIVMNLGELYRGFYCANGYIFPYTVDAQIIENGFSLSRLSYTSDQNYGVGCLQFLTKGRYSFSYEADADGKSSIDIYDKVEDGKFTLKTKGFLPVSAAQSREFELETDSYCMFGFVSPQTRQAMNPIIYSDISVFKQY